ncbi:MAG TPA: LysR substrate-binding domain-containing protein [Sphingorhabdus sp.]|nr:LysR substrate-binding domain-containing protein [Sphingorhabdus sp.]
METNLDLDCLRAFVTIADSGSFTAAAERLLRGQSAISLQVKRLETQLGTRLLDRGPRHVSMTVEGELVLDQARKLLAMNDALIARAQSPQLSGKVRLGVPEDFATTRLPTLLASFSRAQPLVTLEVTCELTLQLLDRFSAGELDLALVKREPTGPVTGRRVWREPLVWAAGANFAYPSESAPLPLVCSPRPCLLRQRATQALDNAGREWRIAYSCGSLGGNHAALRAGLGIAVLPQDMVPHDLLILEDRTLPDLDDVEVALIEVPDLSAPAQRLRDTILHELEHGKAIGRK